MGGPSWIRTRDDTGYEPGALTAELRARGGRRYQTGAGPALRDQLSVIRSVKSQLKRRCGVMRMAISSSARESSHRAKPLARVPR